MYTGKGYFKQYDSMKDLIGKNPERYNVVEEYCERKFRFDESNIFRVGEIVEIKGSRFKVSKIIREGLKLKLLPQTNEL